MCFVLRSSTLCCVFVCGVTGRKLWISCDKTRNPAVNGAVPAFYRRGWFSVIENYYYNAKLHRKIQSTLAIKFQIIRLCTMLQ